VAILVPLFRLRPLGVQLALGIAMPLAFGALCGFVLGWSGRWFNVLMVLGTVGGVAGGYEHVGAREGALRGLAGSLCFAGALLAVFELRGLPSLPSLPLAVPMMTLVYAASGIPLGALGGWLRGRAQRRQ